MWIVKDIIILFLLILALLGLVVIVGYGLAGLVDKLK